VVHGRTQVHGRIDYPLPPAIRFPVKTGIIVVGKIVEIIRRIPLVGKRAVNIIQEQVRITFRRPLNVIVSLLLIIVQALYRK
jgi:hypothetical protein